MIKAIETRYNGYRFRSRLEARWAVFFDTLKLRWSYEVEGFTVTGHHNKPTHYLPDFWLPDPEIFIEIKPMEQPSRIDLEKITAVVAHGNLDVLLLRGTDMATYIGDLFIGSDKAENADFGLLTRMQFSTCPLCDSAGLYRIPEEPGRSYFRCFNQQCVGRDHLDIKREVNWLTPRIVDAIEAARESRFEHGETPRVARGKPKK